MSRVLSDKFMSDLKGGMLASIAERVRRDDTLMLALRGSYINIYYRGGNIVRLAQKPAGHYVTYFDNNFFLNSEFPIPYRPSSIKTDNDCRAWIDALPLLKQHMDFFYWKHPKAEREFQQLVAWENNRAGIASDTEYFITDIEYATDIVRDGIKKHVRLDMLGLKWLKKKGEDGSSCVPVFIEMKYGIKALGGKAGIRDHVDDLESLLEDKSRRVDLCKMIENQFKQLAFMNHIKLDEGRSAQSVKVVDKPEVILLLSNCRPRGNALRNALDTIKKPSSFELRFFVANYAGYAMHEACMMNLDEFKRRLDRTAH